MMNQFWNDETGAVISAELVLVLTVVVLGLGVGLSQLSLTINNELADVASAFGVIDQSFNFNGATIPGKASTAGSGFSDRQDQCDCEEVTIVPPTFKVDNFGSGSLESTTAQN